MLLGCAETFYKEDMDADTLEEVTA